MYWGRCDMSRHYVARKVNIYTVLRTEAVLSHTLAGFHSRSVVRVLIDSPFACTVFTYDSNLTYKEVYAFNLKCSSSVGQGVMCALPLLSPTVGPRN